MSEWFRDLLDRAVWKYWSALLAQPFDVAKTLLQIYVVPGEEISEYTMMLDEGESQQFRDDTSGSGMYVFVVGSSTANDCRILNPRTTRATTSPALLQQHPHPPPPITQTSAPNHRPSWTHPAASDSQIPSTNQEPSSLMEVISRLWTTSGLTSVWKATNATFMYSLLLPTLNTFLRSLCLPIIGLPEIGSASSLTGRHLDGIFTECYIDYYIYRLCAIIYHPCPLDTARTFLIATPLTHCPRSLFRALRLLPTPNYTIPTHLVPITVLHSSLPSLIAMSTPLFLKNYFSIDPVLESFRLGSVPLRVEWIGTCRPLPFGDRLATSSNCDIHVASSASTRPS